MSDTKFVLRSRAGHTGAYVGYQAIAKVMAALNGAEHTPYTLAALTGANNKMLARLLKQMLHLGLADRVGWVKPSHGYVTPIYSMGTGKAIPAPLTPDGRPQPHADGTPKVQERVRIFSEVVAMLRDSPVSVDDMVNRIGVARSRVATLMVCMRKLGLIHVEGYARESNGTPYYRMWVWGGGRDAPRPKPLPRGHSRPEKVLRRSSWASSVMQLKRLAGFQKAICRERRPE